MDLEKWKDKKGYKTYMYHWGYAVKDETMRRWIHIEIFGENGMQSAEFDLYRDAIIGESGIEFI